MKRGVELSRSNSIEATRERIKDIRSKALAQYRRVVLRTAEVQRKLDEQLAMTADNQKYNRVAELQEVLNSLHNIEGQLDSIIIASFEHDNKKQEEFLELMNSIEGRLG